MSFTIDAKQTVGQLVAEQPDRSRVFEQLNIDYCCGGKVTLDRACQKRSLDVESVVKELRSCDQQASPTHQGTANEMGLGELADHIESTHHAYLRIELPRLDALTEKVARVHGDREPKLRQIRETFLELRAELEPHMRKEEQILFPMIRNLEAASAAAVAGGGALANPVAQMELEHDDAGAALARLRELTDDFQPPDWACNTYRVLFDALQQLEADMHQHVHKENNILFRKAMDQSTTPTPGALPVKGVDS